MNTPNPPTDAEACSHCGFWKADYPQAAPRYCSLTCSVRAKRDDSDDDERVNTYSVDNTRHVRVSVFTRDSLDELGDGESHTQTVTRLCGKWTNVNTESARLAGERADAGRYDETTTIRVSENVHDVLTDLRDEMEVSSLGKVVAILVANWRMR